MLSLRRRSQATLCMIAILTSIALVVTPAFSGDAQVSRGENLQRRTLEAGSADVSRYDNLQSRKLEATDTDVTRNNNLLCFRLNPTDADVIRRDNFIGYRLDPNDADVTTNNNLIGLLLEQGLLPQIEITSLQTTDQSGNTKTSFHTGDVVQVRFTVANTGILNLPRGLISVMIQDTSGTPIFLAYTFDDINKGSSKEFVFGLTIPYDAISGQYTAKAMVFTKWPYQGGEGLAVRTTNFTVTI